MHCIRLYMWTFFFKYRDSSPLIFTQLKKKKKNKKGKKENERNIDV